MRKAQIVAPQTPLELCEDAIPTPPPKGAIIKTLYSGICHSDINQWFNEINQGDKKTHFTDNPKYKFPIVPGHEIAGVVHSLGSEVDPDAEDLKVGDEVVAHPWISCGSCRFCYENENSLCDQRHNGLGVGTPGGYATYVWVREKKYLVKVPPSIPLEVACMLPCSGLTTYNAVTTLQPAIERMNKLKGSTSVLLVGAGGLGLWCLQLAKKILPKTTRIVMADINEKNLKVALERGADGTVLWDRNLSEAEAIEITKKAGTDGGFDGVIDMVNSKITAERGFKSTHRGSKMVLVGLYGGGATFALPGFVHGLRTVQGVLVGRLAQLRELVALVAEEKLVPPPLTFYSLDDAFNAMCLVRDGKVQGRCVIKF
uniref:Alcohol dehydrogenase-like n=1 Tax=Ciona intestinalis TaxID=7719 RepID=F6YZ62_CIOIN|nr:uncharacterized protein LOC100184065 [Ciona intestinalis]|eukprot:XP_002119381.1 uncharacterized protein LOC100184065 [Ciona intestinalis]